MMILGTGKRLICHGMLGTISVSWAPLQAPYARPIPTTDLFGDIMHRWSQKTCCRSNGGNGSRASFQDPKPRIPSWRVVEKCLCKIWSQSNNHPLKSIGKIQNAQNHQLVVVYNHHCWTLSPIFNSIINHYTLSYTKCLSKHRQASCWQGKGVAANYLVGREMVSTRLVQSTIRGGDPRVSESGSQSRLIWRPQSNSVCRFGRSPCRDTCVPIGE